MKNELDPFEEALKQTLEGHELPFDPGAWDRLEQRLDAAPASTGTGTPASGKRWLWGGLAGLAAAGAIWVYTAGSGEPAAVASDALAEQSEQPATVSSPNEFQETTPVPAGESDVVSAGPDHSTTSEVSEVGTESTPNTVDPIPSTSEESENPFSTSSTPSQTGAANSPVEESPVREVPAEKPVQNGTEQPAATTGEVQVSQQVVCAGMTVTLSVQGRASGDRMAYRISDGRVVRGSQVVFDTPGEYQITAEGTRSSQQAAVVRVLERPEARMAYHSEVTTGVREVIQARAVASGQTKYQWWLDGKSQRANGGTLQRSFTKSGTHTLTLVAVHPSGCADTTTRAVTISGAFDLLAPTAFSPNGDEHNETWIPRALEQVNRPFTLEIYDASQNLVYSTTQVDRPWDGRRYGEMALEGERYFWVARVTFEDGTVGSYTGKILITLFNR